MGKFLQIRVSAWTYDEDALRRAWPELSALVWPNENRTAEKRGVLELVTALENGLAFGDWPQAVVSELEAGVRRAAGLKRELEEALSDWEPRTANSLSDTLEECLEDLNRKAPKP